MGKEIRIDAALLRDESWRLAGRFPSVEQARRELARERRRQYRRARLRLAACLLAFSLLIGWLVSAQVVRAVAGPEGLVLCSRTHSAVMDILFGSGDALPEGGGQAEENGVLSVMNLEGLQDQLIRIRGQLLQLKSRGVFERPAQGPFSLELEGRLALFMEPDACYLVRKAPDMGVQFDDLAGQAMLGSDAEGLARPVSGGLAMLLCAAPLIALCALLFALTRRRRR